MLEMFSASMSQFPFCSKGKCKKQTKRKSNSVQVGTRFELPKSLSYRTWIVYSKGGKNHWFTALVPQQNEVEQCENTLRFILLLLINGHNIEINNGMNIYNTDQWIVTIQRRVQVSL